MDDIQQPQAEAPAQPGVKVFDISGQTPVLGELPHDQVHEAISSGQFSFPKGTPVPVINPDGELGHLPPEEAPAAFQQGFQYATPKAISDIKYGSAGQQAIAGLEGIAKGFAGPLATAAEKYVAGVPEEDIKGREGNLTHTIGEFGGLGLGLLTGTGEASLMLKAGEAASAMAGLGEASRLAKIGSSAIQQAAEMAVLQSGDEASKMILNDPETSAESAIANVGLASAFGGAGGAFITGAVHPIWEATAGKQLDRLLSGVKTKINGESTDLLKQASDLGIQLKPEVEAAMSEAPLAKSLASTLNQSDTTRTGRGFQEALTDFRAEAADKMVETLGKNPKDLGVAELSKYDSGKTIGESAAKEYESKIDPIISKLEAAREKMSPVELPKARIESTLDTSNPYRMKTMAEKLPGFTDDISNSISKKALEEGWLSNPTSEEARMVKSVLKDLKNKDTLGELIKMGQNLGNSTRSTLPFGMQTPLSRAGTIVRDILKDYENSLILMKLGDESPELLNNFRQALQDYKGVAQLKDQLNDRLKINGSVGKFGKGLREMAKTDGESVLNRLSGAKDAHLLEFMSQHFPETANLIKQYHVDQLLKTASETAKGKADGKTAINAANLMKNIDKMSPELRSFVMNDEQLNKLGNIKDLISKLDDPNHNHSNTARTIEKLMAGHEGTALSFIGALMGGPAGAVIGSIAGNYGKEGASAAQLAMLKYVGSSQPIKAEGFKAGIDFIQNSIKGQNAISKGASAIFKSGAQVLTEKQMPTKADREKLDKQVEKAINHPEIAMQQASNGQTGHYFPNHQQSIVKNVTSQMQYLAKIKPQPYQASPLDRPIAPSEQQMARYNRALDIAQKPTVVLQRIKDGTLQLTDMVDLKSLYPSLYTQMANKITDSMTHAVGDDRLIPYKAKMAISMFLGQPMDSSMQPSSIMAAQPQQPQGGPQQGQPQKEGGMSQAKATAMNKVNKTYMTPLQASQSDRANRKSH